jgi:hypothetical protein
MSTRAIERHDILKQVEGAAIALSLQAHYIYDIASALSREELRNELGEVKELVGWLTEAIESVE